MDFFNKSIAQLRELFFSMTPGARITAGLLLAVVVVSVGYLFRVQATGSDSYLMGGEPFSSDELSVMEAAFGKAGLSDYQRDGNRIRVPEGKAAVYMAALADAEAMPAHFGSYFENFLGEQGIFESKRTKQERLKIAKQNELRLWIRNMRGIRNASVIYDFQEGKGLTRHDVATASVIIEPEGNEPVDRRQARAIRKLVAGAFAGLKSDQVTVVDQNNGPVYAGGDTGGLGDGTDDAYFNLKSLYEQNLEQKISNQLATIPGVRVQVSAELDKEMHREESQITFDPKKVATLQSRTKTETNSTQSGPPSGRPGLSSQGGPGSAPVSLATNRTATTEEKTKEEETQNALPAQNIQVQMKGLTPKRVRASVVVPTSYYRAVWLERNKPADRSKPPEPTAADLQAIELVEKKNIAAAVAPLLPLGTANTDPLTQVTVTTMQSLAPTPLPEPSLAETTLAWTGNHWGTLTTSLLAFFSLLMLRSMIKSIPSTKAAAVQDLPNLAIVSAADEGEPSADEQSPPKRKRRFTKGPTYKDELAEMVREDPDAAATILRAWIAHAG
jgi:flagellar M-ring protein FliF